VAALDVSVTLPPEQKVVGPEGVIVGLAGKGLTVTETCLFTVEYPSLTVTRYVVLIEGVATGFARVDVNPAGIEVQEYVYVPDPPLAAALSCTLSPAQMVPGVAVGDAFKAPPVTFTVTASEFEHPVAFMVAVNVKVVVEERLTVVGSSTDGFTSNEAGVQLNVNGPVPKTEPFKVVLVPLGIVTSLPALTTGKGLTVTTVAADTGLWQPLESVITKVKLPVAETLILRVVAPFDHR